MVVLYGWCGGKELLYLQQVLGGAVLIILSLLCCSPFSHPLSSPLIALLSLFSLSQRTQNIKKYIYMYIYGKCPKILYTKVPDKMAYANSVDPERAV